MRKSYTSFDEATAIYNARLGHAPALTEIEGLYHDYRNVWKHFNGFEDWLLNIGM